MEGKCKCEENKINSTNIAQKKTDIEVLVVVAVIVVVVGGGLYLFAFHSLLPLFVLFCSLPILCNQKAFESSLQAYFTTYKSHQNC